jgi:ABC-type phosphate transport system auxiliary subunit
MKTGSQEALKISGIANNIRMQQRTQQLQQQQQQQQLQQQKPLTQQLPPIQQQQQRPMAQQLPNLQQQQMRQPLSGQLQRKPIPTRGNSSGDLNWQQNNLQQPTMSRRASSVLNVQEHQYNNARRGEF